MTYINNKAPKRMVICDEIESMNDLVETKVKQYQHAVKASMDATSVPEVTRFLKAMDADISLRLLLISQQMQAVAMMKLERYERAEEMRQEAAEAEERNSR